MSLVYLGIEILGQVILKNERAHFIYLLVLEIIE